MKKECMSCIADFPDDFEIGDVDFIDDIPEDTYEITNIYRTKDYIVCQFVGNAIASEKSNSLAFRAFAREILRLRG